MQHVYHLLFQFLCGIALGGDWITGAPLTGRQATAGPCTGSAPGQGLPSRGRP